MTLRSTPPADVATGDVSSVATRAFGWSLLNTVVARFGTVAVGVILARLLGPESFGTFAVATVALLAVLSFNDLGVSLAIVRWRGDPAVIAPTVNTVSIVTSMLLTAAVFVAAPSFSAAMGAPAATGVVRVMAIAILINSVVATPAALLQRAFEQRKRMASDQVNIWLGAVVSLVLAAGGMGAMSLAIGRVTGSLVSGAMLLRWSPLRYRLGFDRAIAAELLRFGLPLAGSSVVLFAASYADQLAAGATLGATALGFYVLASNLSSWPVAIFSQPLRGISPAAFARLQDDVAAKRSAFLATARLLITITLPLCFLLGGSSEQVVRFIYGARWAPAAEVLMFLGLAAAARIFFELTYDYLVIEGRTASLLTIQGIWLALLIPAVILGARVDGIRGVAWSQALVATVVIVPAYGILLRRAGIPLRALGSLGWRPLLVGALAWWVGLLIGRTFPDHAFVACLLTGAAAVVLVVVLGLNDPLVRSRLHDFRARGQVVNIVVYPHDLEIGGSQINAIELAAKTRDRGHSVMIYGRPGALVTKIEELGLEFIAAPRPRRRPSPLVVRHLSRLVRERSIDIVHGYEWPPALEAYLACSKPGSKAHPMATVMSMAVAPFLPHDVSLVVGTEQIADVERRSGRVLVETIEPPVDLHANDPDNTPGREEFRQRWAADGVTTIVCVTRLAHELKLEGILTAIEVVGGLAVDHSLRLLLVGDGPARAEVQEAADRTNATAGRNAVTLVGQLADPRPAYAAGDIQIAMGGSALRSLAFGKPLIVQGEAGFFEVATPETVNQFEWTGWYGVGLGRTTGADALRSRLLPLIDDRQRRRELGDFSRRYVVGRFDLETAADRQSEIYHKELAGAPWRPRASVAARSTMSFVNYAVGRRWTQLTSRSSKSDDFNSKPVAASGHRRHDG